MNNVNQTLVCQCINTRKAFIATPGGKRAVFILELISADGELFTKFLNANLTKAGNLSVNRNSDFAKLYRITTGENPSKRFTRSNELLGHFVGYSFLIRYELANCKSSGEYLRITSIKPKDIFVSDDWTITGHLIRNVRQKKATDSRRIRDGFSKSSRKQHNSNSTLDQVNSRVAGVLDPTLSPTKYTNNPYIINIDSIYKKGKPPKISGSFFIGSSASLLN